MFKCKRALYVICAFVLMITSAGCSSGKDIHQKIHDKFYSMNSYKAKCELTVHSNKNTSKYDFICNYNAYDESFLLTYDNMEVTINEKNNHAKITSGTSVMEVPLKDEDMLIVINTFFKSYYESENSIQKTAGTINSGTTLLKCSLITPSKYGSIMKLWIDNKTVLPVKMQVTDENDEVKLETVFKTFEFIK